MTTKLTLTIDDTVIDSAKKYARQKGKSLSQIVENYLKSISVQDEGSAKLSPKVTRLMGAISLPDDFDYKKQLGEVFIEKIDFIVTRNTKDFKKSTLPVLSPLEAVSSLI